MNIETNNRDYWMCRSIYHYISIHIYTNILNATQNKGSFINNNHKDDDAEAVYDEKKSRKDERNATNGMVRQEEEEGVCSTNFQLALQNDKQKTKNVKTTTTTYTISEDIYIYNKRMKTTKHATNYGYLQSIYTSYTQH